MSTLGEKVKKIRSKNAGPFWITIDIFCEDKKIIIWNGEIVEANIKGVVGKILRVDKIEKSFIVQASDGIIKIDNKNVQDEKYIIDPNLFLDKGFIKLSI